MLGGPGSQGGGEREKEDWIGGKEQNNQKLFQLNRNIS